MNMLSTKTQSDTYCIESHDLAELERLATDLRSCNMQLVLWYYGIMYPSQE